MEYDPDNNEQSFVDEKQSLSDEELRKTVVRRGDKYRQAEEEKAQSEQKKVAEKPKTDKKATPPARPIINMSSGFFNPEQKSEFKGGAFSLYFMKLLVNLISVITLGLAYPAMVCMYNKWLCSHTYINGRKMRFDGNGLQLFGKYLLWAFLTVITLGIYSFWLAVNMKKWIVSHTHYVDEEGEQVKSEFTGGAIGMFFVYLGALLLSVVTLSIGTYWAICFVQKWTVNHTVVDSYKMKFTGKGGALLGKCIVWFLLTLITLGIYHFWLEVKYKKWTVSKIDGINE